MQNGPFYKMDISCEGLKFLIGTFCVCFEGFQFNDTAFAMPYNYESYRKHLFVMYYKPSEKILIS